MADLGLENEALRAKVTLLTKRVIELERMMEQQGASATKNIEIIEDYGVPVAWTVIFKKSHPGSLGSLRKSQRDTIIESILEFLKLKLNPRLIRDCVQNVRGRSEIAIPESLIEDYQTWFDIKLDEDDKPKAALLGPEKRQQHALNTMAETAMAKEMAKNFIPGNEFAVELINVCTKIHPLVVISLQKFTSLFESFCPIEINRRLHICVNADQILQKFEQVFDEEIKAFNSSSSTKRKLEEPAKGAKKSKAEALVLPEIKKEILKAAGDQKKVPEAKKYTLLLKQIYANYSLLPTPYRLEMKRKVKRWLKSTLSDDFDESRVLIDDGGKTHVTFCIPAHIESKFLRWAEGELRESGGMI